jgi:lysylphosphatidylglycerol synthetase-like protein (DUF2156 family)
MANQHHTDIDGMRMELQEAIVTFREQITLLVQIAGVLVGADVALIGYGFAQAQGVVLLVANIIPIILIVLVHSEADWTLACTRSLIHCPPIFAARVQARR